MAIVNASNLKTTQVLTAAAAFLDPSGSLPWVDDEDDELGMSTNGNRKRERGVMYVAGSTGSLLRVSMETRDTRPCL